MSSLYIGVIRNDTKCHLHSPAALWSLKCNLKNNHTIVSFTFISSVRSRSSAGDYSGSQKVNKEPVRSWPAIRTKTENLRRGRAFVVFADWKELCGRSSPHFQILFLHLPSKSAETGENVSRWSQLLEHCSVFVLSHLCINILTLSVWLILYFLLHYISTALSSKVI